MSKKLSNRFNFFVEADLQKGKDDNGKDVVIIDGIASTSSTDDSDGETLYPNGFNLAPFLESGLINYNHQGSKDANAVIGVPLEAKIINGGKDLYVKCMLWDCPQTQGIVRAYENFKKHNIDRKVGFSIEGQSTLRGSSFKESPLYKKVLKADVTGLAVTFSPKCKNTLMNIIKGEYEDAFIDINDGSDNSLDVQSLVEEYNEWTSAKKGDEFYGKEGSVKEFLENNHEDHLALLSDLLSAINDTTQKAMDTAAIAPTIPESVEHNKKDITKNFVSNNINTNFGKELKKSQLFTAIAKKYPTSSIADKKSIFSFIEETNTKLFKMEVITPEALQKAMNLLDEATALVKGEENTELTKGDDIIIKGEDAVDFESEDVRKAVEYASLLQKGGMSKEDGCEYLKKGGFAAVAQQAWEKALSEMQAQQNGGEPTSQEVPLFKAEEINGLISTEVNKSLTPVNEALSKGFEGLNLMFKSLQETNTSLVQQNTELAKRLERLESTPSGRKSVANAAFAERFNKSKDADVNDANSYNVKSQEDLNRLSDVLLEEHANLIEKGRKETANMIEGTINSIELYKTVPEYAYQYLAQKGIKLVAPSA